MCECVFCNKNNNNRYLKAQIAEKEARARLEKDANFHALNQVPLYPAEISSHSPQDVRKQKQECVR